MSEIINSSLYTGLNRIYFFTKETNFINGGVFDLEGRINLDSYKSGMFIPEQDLFDDSVYEGHECINVTFKHYTMTFLGLRILGLGHMHEKVFVSTDPNIPISQIFYQTPNNDLIIFGKPRKVKGEKIPLEDGGELKLYEIDPYITKDEIKLLINDINAVTIFKRNTVDATVRAHQASVEAFLQLSRATAAESSNIVFGTIINTLLKKFEIATQKLIEMKISSNVRLQDGIERAESELDLDVPWNSVRADETERMLEDVKSDLNFLTALKNNNPEPSEQVKAYAYSLAIEICGIKYIQDRLSMGTDAPKHINTLGGLATNYLSNQVKAQSSPQDMQQSVERLISFLQTKYNQNGGNMQQAITELNDIYGNEKGVDINALNNMAGTPKRLQNNNQQQQQ